VTFPSARHQPVTVGLFAKALGMLELWRSVAAIAAISQPHPPEYHPDVSATFTTVAFDNSSLRRLEIST